MIKALGASTTNFQLVVPTTASQVASDDNFAEGHTQEVVVVPECVSPGIPGRFLVLRRRSLWCESVWSASSPERRCMPEWWLRFEQPGCLLHTVSVLLWETNHTNPSMVLNSGWNNIHGQQTTQHSYHSGVIFSLKTFTGEGRSSFVHRFSFLCSFGGLLFGHQVLWNRQGTSTDSQLEQSSRQPIDWHLRQEALDVLGW